MAHCNQKRSRTTLITILLSSTIHGNKFKFHKYLCIYNMLLSNLKAYDVPQGISIKLHQPSLMNRRKYKDRHEINMNNDSLERVQHILIYYVPTHVIMLHEAQLRQMLKIYMCCKRLMIKGTVDTVRIRLNTALLQHFLEKVMIKYRAPVWIHPKRVTHRWHIIPTTFSHHRQTFTCKTSSMTEQSERNSSSTATCPKFTVTTLCWAARAWATTRHKNI